MAAGYTIEQLLGLPALMGLMQETTTGLPDPIPKVFDPEPKKVIGNAARLFVGYGQRKTAQFVKYGSPAKQTGLENLGFKDYVLLSSAEVQPIDPLSFQRLHQFDNYDMQKMGAGEVARQVGLFKAKFENARKVAKWSTLRHGKLWADSSGNLLPSSSGASSDWTLDFGVAAGHQTQLNVFGTGAIIDASWATTSTKIPTHIENLQAAAAKETGLELKYAIYGSNVPSAIRTNLNVQPFMPFDSGMYRTLNRSTTIPDGLLGLTWIPAQKAFYEDSSGTLQSMFGANEVIFTPDPKEGGWWELIEGSQILPNTIDVSQRTATDIMRDATTVHGMWAATRYQFDPISLLNYFGDNFLYALRNPKAVYQATCIF